MATKSRTTSRTKKRTYSKTHPWITFSLDLREADYGLWLKLGDAQARCHYLSGVPLMPSIAQHLHQVFVAKGVLGTTAIEGNTLSEDEVIRLLEGTLELPPSKEYLKQEIDNIVEACNLIADQILGRETDDLDVEKVLKFNAQVLKALPLDEDVELGQIRSHDVGVGSYPGAPHQDCEYLLHRLVDWLGQDFQPTEGNTIVFGLLKAIMAHLYIARIHPFGDGNGRTARLMEFQILLSSGVPATAAHLLSNHYNQTRAEYYRRLDESSKSGGDPIPFIRYALQGLVDGLEEQLEIIRAQQLDVHWVNFIHDQFRDKDRVTSHRRRRLAIDLSYELEPIPVSKVRHISPRIAEAYADRSDKTVSRDVDRLVEMNLVVKSKEGVRVNRELMRAFLPPIRNGGEPHNNSLERTGDSAPEARDA